MNRLLHRGEDTKSAPSAAGQQNTRGAKRARSLHQSGVFRRLLVNFLLIGLVPITVLAFLAIVYSTR
ncbi:MAG TPA: hypothetical protein PLR57_06675, partial [Clostridia bacterium]|nr:hypothetical protein [Clostridia bacterium]